MNFGFPRLYEDGTITVCKSVKGHKKNLKREIDYKKLGKRKKSFELTSRKKRLIKCSAIRQYHLKKYSLKFVTLTFPGKVNQSYANECFSKFIDNLTNNYKLYSYVAVKENHKSGNPHFHLIIDIPFVDYRILNKAWNKTFSDKFNFSNNAFTSGRNSVISNIRQITSYVTKYISKAENSDNELKETRIYFISTNILSNPQLIDENTLIYLTTKFKYKFYSNDHYSIYLIKNLSCLPEFYSKNPEEYLSIKQKFKAKKELNNIIY